MKKKRMLAVFIPTVAMLLSGCSFIDTIKNFFGIQEKEEARDGTISIPELLRTEIGASTKLTIKSKPKDYKLSSVKWTSANNQIATVKDGTVVGKGVGTTSITLTAKSETGKTLKSTCKVTVSEQGKEALKYTYDDYNVYSAYGTDNCPLNGTAKLLVFPIWFDDSDEFITLNQKDAVRDDIITAFKGSNKANGWRSLKTFYEEESFGALKLDITVTDWYEPGKSYKDYAYYPNGASATRNLVTSACNNFFKNSSKETRTDYDTNNDGYLDSVLLIYAAPDCQNLGDGSMENLWAYTSWMFSTANKTNPKANAFFWGSYDFMYSYGDDAESKTGSARYGRGDTRYCSVDSHCYIHEMGHVLGLSDYYDYSGQKNPSGGFSMQDSNVGGHDPYSVLAYGWGSAYKPTETTTITINDFQSSHDVILLGNHNVTSVFDEYMLLELYSPTGLNEHDSEYTYLERYPQGPEDIGIRLWHVDSRLTYYDYNTQDWSRTLTTNPKKGWVNLAMTNTYYDSIKDNINSISPLGIDYADYNILELIRKDKDHGDLNYTNLFFENDSFAMSDYTSFFVNNTNMNDGNELGWSFKVDKIEGTTATITVTKL